MSYPQTTKKKKSKPKQSQTQSRSKSPRPSARSNRSKRPIPSLNKNSQSHQSPRPKPTKKTHKTSTPTPTNKPYRIHTSTPKTPKTPRTPRTPRTNKSNKSPRPKSSKTPIKTPKCKTPKCKTPKSRTISSPLHKTDTKTPKRKTNKNKNKSKNKQRTASTPKPKSNSKTRTTSTPKPKGTHIKKPILKQSHSSSVDHSMDQSLIDETHNLSPKKNRYNNEKGKNKMNKKVNAKKRSFYNDIYSTKNKGKLQGKYKVKEKIGSGTFSTVRRGIRRSDKQEIAIKIITKTDLTDTEARLIKREIGVMEKLSNHSHIVKLYDIFETTHHLYLVIEYCKGGELFDELINCTPKGWFSERETSQIIRQIAFGLKYMHTKNIIHRDLKLENVLISTKQSYHINKKKKKFSVDTTENSENNNTNSFQWNKTSKTERGTKPMTENNDSDENEDLNNVINRRHSDCISQIPHSILYGHNTSDHKGPETSIMIKISDFGLSKKFVPPDKNTIINEEKEQEKKKKKHKIPHILSKKYKKKKKDEFNDREFAVMATNCGTLYYVAPEILNNEPYNEKVDCWSLGVICYVLLCGSLPFYSENELEISDLILKCKYDLGETDDHWLKVSESAKDLIKNLLTLDKKNRFSVTQVLNHPFVTGQNQLMSNKRRSVKWNAGGLFAGKWPMKFKNILDSAKNISFHHESSDNDTDDYMHTNPPLSPNNNGKKVKYKIPFDSNLQE